MSMERLVLAHRSKSCSRNLASNNVCAHAVKLLTCDILA